MIGAGNTVALVLAGGRSRRMGGIGKAALLLGGRALLSRVVERVAPQVDRVFLNLNGALAVPGLDGYTVIPDLVAGFPGPLTGLVSAWEYLQSGDAPPPAAVLVVPCDGPFLPTDLGARLFDALTASGADVACAARNGEPQPTFSLWRPRALDRARTVFFEQREGGFKGVLMQLHTTFVEWPQTPINPFFNINTPQDLERAETLLAAFAAAPVSGQNTTV